MAIAEKILNRLNISKPQKKFLMTLFQLHRKEMQDKDYAYHWGGRDECQFNIRFLGKSDYNYVEFGLAFSLESERGISVVNEVRPRILRFNDLTMCLS